MASILGRIKLRRLTKVDVAFLHFKAALAIMLWSPMWSNPTMQKNLTGQFLTVWIAVTVLGFFVSVAGLIMGAQAEDTRIKGFKIEMVGLWLLMSGPLVFMAVMGGLWISTGENRGLAVMFPYVVAAALYARMVMVKSAMKTILYRFPGEAEDELEEKVVRAEHRAGVKAEARADAAEAAEAKEAERDA